MISCELSFSLERMITGLLFPSLVAVIAWWLTNWLLGPLLEAFKDRRVVFEYLVFYANVYPASQVPGISDDLREVYNQEWIAATKEIRRLAAKMKAHAGTLPNWQKSLVYKITRIDFWDGGAYLIGLSNCITRTERSLKINDIEVALNFKRTLDDNAIAGLKIKLGQGI